MTRTVRESTAIIDESLARLQLPVSKLLKPGISAESIRDRLSNRDLSPGPDLETLYGWHDGTQVHPGAILNDLHLLPGYFFLSLDDALEVYERFVDQFQENPNWFPILADGGSSYSFVDCSNVTEQPVYRFNFDDDEHKVEFRSIRDMLATYAEAYIKGFFFVDENGWIEMDDDAYWDLAAEMNPTAPYWQG
ncbi:hypothetical protein J2T11_000152 [Paenarthrobacter nicotinovorans]|uniref:SMI1/KNR4 family protein n=1 Tax=Paenarthrobacter nicotinovorans TaxID=29320 RepID=UPI002780EEBE|nr:SMI1/KNR4 family protein [Paenarthrobacter nicotinovorans]MDP9933828.1 hypothetical protein [Paenarthrobacter nicotinovorans]